MDGFTYSELYKKFREAYPSYNIIDYRPYPLCDYGIIVLVTGITGKPANGEIAYRYNPKKNIFTVIPDAKTYEEIINMR